MSSESSVHCATEEMTMHMIGFAATPVTTGSIFHVTAALTSAPSRCVNFTLSFLMLPIKVPPGVFIALSGVRICAHHTALMSLPWEAVLHQLYPY